MLKLSNNSNWKPSQLRLYSLLLGLFACARAFSNFSNSYMVKGTLVFIHSCFTIYLFIGVEKRYLMRSELPLLIFETN